MNRSSCFRSALAGCALVVGLPLKAQSGAVSAEALLSIMVRKGLITREEAAELKQEAQASVPSIAASPAPAPASPGSTAPAPTPASAAVVRAASASSAPLSFKIGSADFTPFGFADLSYVYRSSMDGGDLNSAYGSIPYSNVAASKLSESRLSAKNSRLGLRVDSVVGDSKVLGYIETDFFGNAPTNLNVTTNSDTLRMRSAFVSVRRGAWELLGGQAWSLMTPNRKGASPVTSDQFYSQNADANYQVGLVWGRTPQVRLVYHASDEVTFAVSAENPDQFVGSALTLPAGFNSADVDIGSSGTATPNIVPDFVGKVAWDTKVGDLPLHADAAVLVRDFKVNTFATGASPVNANASAVGTGGSVNAILTVAPGFQLIENAFVSQGGGRYLSTGLGPDFVVLPANASGTYTLSTVKASGGIGGFEWDIVPTSKLFGYYGFVRYGSDYAALANGSYVGYGYPGSPTTQNKQVDEFSLGEAQILWKKEGAGDLKVITQVAYLSRSPFFVPVGAPSKAHLGMLYLDFRYDLP